jgi:hypothetical protein
VSRATSGSSVTPTRWPFLGAQIPGLLEDERWDIAYLRMQIVIEPGARRVRRHLHRVQEPLLRSCSAT